jgi:rod shape-determining protein MreD
MNHVILKLVAVDLVIILAVYLFIFHGETGAGIFILGQGLLIDLLSGGMLGLFTLLYLIVFLSIKLASRPLDLQSTGGLVIIIFMSVLIKEILMVFFLFIFSREVTLSVVNLWSFILSSLCSGVIAPFVFDFMNILARLLNGEGSEI